MGALHLTHSKGLNFSFLRIFLFLALIIFKGQAVMAQTPSAATSTVTVSPSIIPLNGTATITVQLREANGTAITSGATAASAITFLTPSSGTIGTVTNTNNGTYSAVYSAGGTAGSIIITPRLSGVDFTNTAVITVGNGQLLRSNPAGTSTNTTSYSTTGGLALVLGLDAEYLVVGGGGGGGGGFRALSAGAGGGGGGGWVSTGSTAVDFTSFSVSVGSGGGGGIGVTTGNANPGSQGGSSSIFGITSLGGSGGGAGNNTGTQNARAGNGGGSAQVISGIQTNRTGGTPNWEGAGGGAGAGNNGYNGSDLSGNGGIGGAGGVGVASDINGISVTYGGGGGGGGSWDGSGSNHDDGSGGNGGDGGGGNGSKLPSTAATAGSANRGGGGGGGGYTDGSTTTDGNAGGSGVVIVRYQGADIATGGTKSTTTVGSQTYNVHTFNVGGTFSLFPTNAYLSTLSATYSGVLSGDGALTYNNLGTLELTGVNTYTGGTNIQNGTLKFSSPRSSQADAESNVITLSGSSTLVFNGHDIFLQHVGTPKPRIILNSGTTLTNGGAYYNVLGPVTLSGGTLTSTAVESQSGQSFAFKGTVTVNGNTTSTISGNGFGLGAAAVTSTTFNVSDGSADEDLLVSGVLRDGAGATWPTAQASALTKSGAGKMVLTGANTYTGSTTVSAGVLNTRNATGTGTTAGGVSVTSGAALELQGGITIGAEALTINSTGVSNGGAFRNISGNNTWGGTVTLGSASRINSEVGTLTLSATNAITGTYNLTIGGAGNTTVSGTITTSTGTLTKDGAGTLLLTGANTYSGLTTVSAGTLQLNRSGGTTIPATNNVTVSGGTLKVSSNQELNNLTVSSGSLVVDAGVTLTISGTFTGGGTITNNGTIIVKGSSSFPGSTTTISAMNNLTIDRLAGVTLDKDITVTGTLTLTTGILDIGTTTLTVSGSIAGASSSNYIKTSSTGGLKQSVNNAATTFPVGNSGYNPISITNNTGSADNFTIRVIDEVYADGSSSGTTVSTLRVKRTWDIAKATPSANAGTGVDMVFNWNPASHTSGTLVVPKLYHYESSAWVKKSIISNTTYDVANGTLTFTGYKGDFSPFSIIDDGLALPVTWLSFTGRAIHGEVELNWATASEQNNSHFEVERSADAVLFNKIGRVNAAVNPRIRNDYRYLDQQPLAGRSFYRLKQVDIDGKFSYSSIIQINGVTTQGFKAWVLPGSNQLTLQVPQTIIASSTMQVYDASGRLVLTKHVLPGLNQIDLASQSGGVYHVRITQGGLLLYSSSVIK